MSLVYIFGVLLLIHLVFGQNTNPSNDSSLGPDSNETNYKNRPYCYRFTWIGPKYNAESSYQNASCEDVLRGANAPCLHPLVVTNNSNVPDTRWIWDNYKMTPSNVACRLVRGEVCAKFTYTYNNAIENITYMCTKVNIEGEGAAPKACYKEFHNATGREIEVCTCESKSNDYPCNNGKFTTVSQFILSCIFVIILSRFT